MAMKVATKSDEEDEPPKGGELSNAVRSIATPRKVVPHGVFRMSAPDMDFEKLLTNYRAMRFNREHYQLEQAQAASISADGEVDDRNDLDAWLAHSESQEYTSFIKQRPVLTHDDYVEIEVDGQKEIYCAPQRMKRVKLLAKDEETGERYAVFELRREKTMTPDQFEQRPAQYINDWSELGVKRAKKAYLKRREASHAQRRANGRDPIEMLAIKDELVRRPPSLMWLLNHPDGESFIYGEPWPNGIMCPEAADDMRKHNLLAAEFVNNEKYPTNSMRSALDAYAENLRRREISYTEPLTGEEGVSEVEFGPKENPDKLIQQRKNDFIRQCIADWPQKDYAAIDYARKRIKIGKHLPPALTHNEPEEGLRVVEGEYIPANEPEFHAPVLASLPQEMEEYIEETVHETFSSLRETGYQVTGSYPYTGQEELFLAGGCYMLDYNDPRTLDLLELLVKRHDEIGRVLVNKLAKARLAQGDIHAWPAIQEPSRKPEMNLEGLVDDGVMIEMEVERIKSDESERSILHNRAEFERYKRECTVEEQNSVRFEFFRRTKKYEKRRTRAARMARNNVRKYNREKMNDIRKYYYNLLYNVRKINEPYVEEIVPEHGLLLPSFERLKHQWQDWREKRRLKRMSSADYPTYTAADYRVSRAIAQCRGMHKKLSGYQSVVQTILDQISSPEAVSTVPERPRESVKEVHEQVVKHAASPTHGWRNIGEDWGVLETELRKEVPAPIRAVPIPMTGRIYIEGGDYHTPLGELWRKYIVRFGGPQPRRYFREEEHEQVEETERDQVIGPAAYRSPEHRRPIAPGTGRRARQRRAQRQSLVA